MEFEDKLNFWLCYFLTLNLFSSLSNGHVYLKVIVRIREEYSFINPINNY
jgi:hypothetical protein